MPIDKIEYILIGDGKDIQTPTKTFTIHLPPIKVKIPKKKKKGKDNGN